MVSNPWTGFSGITMSDIARMTDFQLIHIYQAKRDEDGRLEADDAEEGGASSFENVMKEAWRQSGRTEAEIEERWQAYKEKMNGGQKS